ncbi:MAG: hypothetical protein SF029_11910 [bacterium]|nr:hypothetical protein [bacterium]
MHNQPRKWHDEELNQDIFIDPLETESLDDLLEPGQLVVSQPTESKNNAPVRYAFRKRGEENEAEGEALSETDRMPRRQPRGRAILLAFVAAVMVLLIGMGLSTWRNVQTTAPMTVEVDESLVSLVGADILEERLLNDGNYYLVDNYPSLSLYRCEQEREGCTILRTVLLPTSDGRISPEQFQIEVEPDFIDVYNTQTEQRIIRYERPSR